jgi:CubicO group peptidase (beta-lactamase class C family)
MLLAAARRLSLALVLAAAALQPAWAAGKSAPPALPPGARPADIDRLVARAQQVFTVPGVSVAIVKDGQTLFAKGYGVRANGKPEKVDADTLFGIGSNTKAFTVAALATLVDQGKLHWDDKVIDLMPQVRLYDPYVTRELTVRDILTHRSGLGLGSGDLMLFPQSDFTRAEIIHNLRYFPPASSFRSKYAYDNLLYILAGELVPTLSGVSWEDYVQTKILDRLGGGCAATVNMIKGPDVAKPHVLIDGKLIETEQDRSTAYDPAGSIQCSANGMAAWAKLQLADGKFADGTPLFSSATHAEMWTPQTIEKPLAEPASLVNTHFRNYGLAFVLEDYRGYRRVTHTGGLIGMVSYVSLVPEKNLGIVVLTNQQSGGAMASVMMSLLDAFLDTPSKAKPAQDWVGWWKAKSDEGEKQAAAADQAADASAKAAGGKSALPLDAYVGTYHDVWRGDATVRKVGDKLRLAFSRTTGMQGDMTPMKANVFVVRWDDKTLKADALVNFRTGMDGAVSGMTMAPLSPTTDFSFDFQDLDFAKLAAAGR